MQKSTMKHVAFIGLIVLLSTLLAFGFEQLSLRRENILLIYVASIMIITIQTKSIRNGFITTLILVFIFNFFFTEPKFTFIIDDINYIITLVIFGVVLVITGAQTTNLQHQIHYANSNAKKIESLYDLSSRLLHVTSVQDVIKETLQYLKQDINRLMSFVDEEGNIWGDSIIEDLQIPLVKRLIKDRISGGAFEMVHRELGFKVLIVLSSSHVYGALCIDCIEGDIHPDDREFLKTVLLMMTSVLEREYSVHIEHISRIAVEKERLKSTLLRSISHDLRTPLTTLQTGLSLLDESYNMLDDATKIEMVQELLNETGRLTEFVENVLYMTRLNAENNVLHRQMELVDDLFNAVKERVVNRLGDHQLLFEDYDDTLVYVDGQLMIQVLTNLVDNAIKHTHPKTEISLSYHTLASHYVFEVIDNGGGIPDEQLVHIFEDSVSYMRKPGDAKRGVGFGLYICQSIVHAHGGWIKAMNNHKGGATFHLEIPKLGGDPTDDTTDASTH